MEARIVERKTPLMVALVWSLVLPLFLPAGASAQSRSGRGGLYGDWRIKMKRSESEFGEFEAILAFSRNQEGYTGQWIGVRGTNELKDVKFEENKLSWTMAIRYGEQGDRVNTWKFTGTIEQGELSGLMANDRGELEIKGKRAPRLPRAVGSWEMKINAGEREYTGTLTITADKEGNLSGMWKSSRGESKVSDVKYEDRKLTFKRVIERDSGSMEMTFEGTLGFNSLEGVFKSDRGEAPTEGTRLGAAVIGTWNLDVESERRTYKQRLRVNSDLSALYGPTVIKKVNLDGDKISFEYTIMRRDQEYKYSFEGKIAESKLTGEVKTERGKSKVTGTRRTFRRRNTGQ
jgi:hypothetical protein